MVSIMKTFIVSDTHFGHAGVCKCLRDDGTKLRPWDDPNEMDEYMVDAWNKVVGKTDKVYHLGDVVINKKSLSILRRLNGDKVLVKGNHDIFKLGDYTNHFRDIRAYWVLDNMIMSHIPVHPDSKGRFRANIHGHTHYRSVMKLDKGREVIDPWYYCVCVEHTEYAPVDFEDVREKIKNLGV